MKACIVSGDTYLRLGLLNLLSNAGYETYAVDQHYGDITRFFEYNNGTDFDFIFCDMRYDTRSLDFFVHGVSEETRFIFITDPFVTHDVIHNDFFFSIVEDNGVIDLAPILSKINDKGYRYYLKRTLNLSSRERRILLHYINGETPTHIAQNLNITAKTFSNYKIRALNKLGVRRVSIKTLTYLKTCFLFNKYGFSFGFF
ncbi:hypothetical protein GIX45_07885 [Erwinia sp. CPCC 100877]|nr:hypothetical protein [Erwinia sp. CPCC 100877]